jgi:hypothetical protein
LEPAVLLGFSSFTLASPEEQCDLNFGSQLSGRHSSRRRAYLRQIDAREGLSILPPKSQLHELCN